MMRPYLVRTGVAVDTEDCAGIGVDLCVGCVDESEVFPGDGGGDGGRPVTGVPGCPARYTPGCWSEDAVGQGSCLTVWSGEKTAPDFW